jgi:hypothetical protein
MTVIEFPRPKEWQEKVYRTMCDLANLANDYLKESDDRPWRNQVAHELRKAIEEARAVVSETTRRRGVKTPKGFLFVACDRS